ncbi:MAG: selenide, water dikinase SelD [Ferruginibacter sp.]
MTTEISKDETPRIKLTQYSRGAGCGCKVAPKILEEILQTTYPVLQDKNLIVGNSTRDDAAVYNIGDGNCVISTTDFFMPVVDDAFDFGMIASANAISDVYAMGGRPLMAVAILGWPADKLPAALAQEVLDGARKICADAGIPLAGGHSIDSIEPMFGLAVTGMAKLEHVKQNNTAKEGDILFLTKPIGVGILTTAQKKGVLKAQHELAMITQMTQLNKLGEQLGKIKGVSAMTDITGFGLLGHLIEMAAGAGLSAEIYYSKILLTDGVKEYLPERTIPDATFRNWNSYSVKVGFEKEVNVMEAFSVLPDPQTNGGLLFSVSPGSLEEIKDLLRAMAYRITLNL